MMGQPKQALYADTQRVWGQPAYDCKIVPAFLISKPGSPSSIAFPKKSPYKKFFRSAILDFRQSGKLSRAAHRYKLRPPNCEVKNRATALSIFKLASLFVIIAFGIGLSLVFLGLEVCMVPFKQKKSQAGAQLINQLILRIKSAQWMLEKGNFRNKKSIQSLIKDLDLLKQEL